MYGPPPPRPKKTDITRSRGGCLSCRSRRKKCDEKKPACSSCVRLGRRCEQPPPRSLAFRAVTFDLEGSGSRRPPPSAHDDQGENLASLRPYGGRFLTFELSAETDCLPEDPGLSDANLAGQVQGTTAQATSLAMMPALDDFDDRRVGFITPSVTENDGTPLHHEVSHPSLPSLSGGDNNHLPMQVARLSGQLSFYSEVWKTHCIPGIHPALGRLTHFSALPPPLLDAVLAVAACRISRVTPRKKSFDPRGTPGLSSQPDPGHRAASCERYGSALLGLARWTDIGDPRELDVALTGMVLLAHLEAMNGDFGQFESHSAAIEKLVSSRAGGAMLRRSTCQLLANWTQARAHNWWRRFHFSTQGFQGSGASMACSPWLASVLEEAGDRRAVIMVVLCECCSLQSVAFLARWKVTDLELGSPAKPDGIHDQQTNLLLSSSPAAAAQQAALDLWHHRLPLSELPIERFLGPLGCAASTDGFEVKPLQFGTHQAAMNYAYYVVARLLLCEFATDGDMSPSCVQDAAARNADAWCLLLARIAAGINWDDCVRLNAFVIGFSTLLIPCVLHCPDVRVGLWLQDWLEQRYTAAAPEEGNFPVLQGLLALRAINRERRAGRVVRAVFVADEDSGTATKYDSYDRQHLRSLWVYGYDMATGKWYSGELAL